MAFERGLSGVEVHHLVVQRWWCTPAIARLENTRIGVHLKR